jgi:hypothetical protein
VALVLALTSLGCVAVAETYGLMLLGPFLVVAVDVVGAAVRVAELRGEASALGPGDALLRGAFVLAPASALALYGVAAHAPALLARPFAGPACEVLVGCAGAARDEGDLDAWPTDMQGCFTEIGGHLAHRPVELRPIRAWLACVHGETCEGVPTCEAFLPYGAAATSDGGGAASLRGWPWRR